MNAVIQAFKEGDESVYYSHARIALSNCDAARRLTTRAEICRNAESIVAECRQYVTKLNLRRDRIVLLRSTQGVNMTSVANLRMPECPSSIESTGKSIAESLVQWRNDEQEEASRANCESDLNRARSYLKDDDLQGVNAHLNAVEAACGRIQYFRNRIDEIRRQMPQAPGSPAASPPSEQTPSTSVPVLRRDGGSGSGLMQGSVNATQNNAKAETPREADERARGVNLDNQPNLLGQIFTRTAANTISEVQARAAEEQARKQAAAEAAEKSAQQAAADGVAQRRDGSRLPVDLPPDVRNAPPARAPQGTAPPSGNAPRQRTPGRDASACVKLEFGEAGGAYLTNSCGVEVEAKWCEASGGRCSGGGGTWTIQNGARWPLNVRGNEVIYGACIGPNSIESTRVDIGYKCWATGGG